MTVITVGMPVFNGEQYLEGSIKSVLAQTFDDFEFLISDNASTDRSGEISRDYAAKDSRIRYLHNETNIGAAANYNRLFVEGKSKYFRWSNADDLLAPTLHEKCLAALEGNPAAVLAAGRTIIIDENGEETRHYDDNLHLTSATASERLQAFLTQVGLTNVIYGLMRRDALGRTDLMGDGKLPAADTVMMGQLVLQGLYLQIDEPLFYRRMHDESSSADRSDNSRQESFWSAGRSQFRRPNCRRIAAYLRGISNASVNTADTFALYKIVAHLMWKRKRELSLELLGRR